MEQKSQIFTECQLCTQHVINSEKVSTAYKHVIL